MDKMNKEIIEAKKQFNRMMQKLKSEATVKKCFHPNKKECKMPIKNAHSLQRQGSLQILEKDEKGNKYLYIHSELHYNSKNDFLDLKMVGRKTATTFYGFCSFHDTELFKIIENEPEVTDVKNNEHCFLHSYRSFAIAVHRKLEDNKLYNSTDEEVITYLNWMYSQLSDLKTGVSLALDDLEAPKKLINNWLIEKDFSKLKYLCFEYDYTIPIGCASYITPYQLPSGKSIQMDLSNENESSIITTVLPFSNRSVVILAAFPNDKLGCQFLDELKNIKDKTEQQKFLSFFLFTGAENIVVSPHYIEKKTIEKRKEYCGLIQSVTDYTTPFLNFDVFLKFDINYFSKNNAI